jgi:curved DNA-binding protein
MARDYYAVLGVSRAATDKEIRQAYRRLARKYHPDVNPGNKDAETRFKEVNESYQVLSEHDKRAKYDRFGENWRFADGAPSSPSGHSGPFRGTQTSSGRSGSRSQFDIGGLGLEDILGGFFGSHKSWRGESKTSRNSGRTELQTKISLEDAYRGTSRVIEIPSSPMGRDLRRLEVKIPPGVDTGSRVRVHADKSSDILLMIEVEQHPRFERKGDDLHTDIEIPIEDAALGIEVQISTLKGRVLLKIPQDSQNGRVFRLANQGMPRLRANGHGNLYATLKAMLPTPITDEQRDLFRQMKRLRTTP